FNSALAVATAAVSPRPSFLTQQLTTALDFGTTILLTLSVPTTSTITSGAAAGGGGGDETEDPTLEPASDQTAKPGERRKAKEALPAEGTPENRGVNDAATPPADRRPPADASLPTPPLPAPRLPTDPVPDEISALDQVYSGDMED